MSRCGNVANYSRDLKAELQQAVDVPRFSGSGTSLFATFQPPRLMVSTKRLRTRAYCQSGVNIIHLIHAMLCW